MPFDLDTTLHPATLTQARTVRVGGQDLKVAPLNFGNLSEVALSCLSRTYPTLTKNELTQSAAVTAELFAVIEAALSR